MPCSLRWKAFTHKRRSLFWFASTMANPISVKVLVDKEKNRVVFAEAESDFVDVLFSFLTLPLGSIVKLVGAQTGLGSLDTLYHSVQKIDGKHLQREACRDMLLCPRNAAEQQCEVLKLTGIHEANPRKFYLCRKDDCWAHSTCYYSTVGNVGCSRCGKPMDKNHFWNKTVDNVDGVFVRERTTYLITDDLQVMPDSLKSSHKILEELGIEKVGNLEQRTLQFGAEEATNFLKRSLSSSSAFTEMCFPGLFDARKTSAPSEAEGITTKAAIGDYKDIEHKETESKEHKLRLILNKVDNSVLYAEAGEEFIDQLFSFLTFPLGAVLGLLQNRKPLGCIHNLYKSIKNLGLDCLKSEGRSALLQYPKLAPHFGCANQILSIDEKPPIAVDCKTSSCFKCHWENIAYFPRQCKHGVAKSRLVQMNPKSPKGGEELGYGFVRGPAKFMVTNNFQVSPLSPISSILSTKEKHLPKFIEKEVSVGEAQILDLLHAMLHSTSVLTDVFSPKCGRRRPKAVFYY